MSTIDLSQWTAFYSNLQPQAQIEHLACIGNMLTVCARDAYPTTSEHLTSDQRIRVFQGINEVLHQVTQHISHVNAGRKERYPDDVLCAIIMETGPIYGVQTAIQWSIQRAIESER